MLPKTHRFHGYNALNVAYKQGQTVRGPLLSLKYFINPRRQTFRVAIVVSKKVSKSAVIRNRIRRRIYATVRLYEDQIHDPYDLILTAFSEALVNMDGPDLKRLVGEQLHKAGVTAPPLESKRAIVSTEGKSA